MSILNAAAVITCCLALSNNAAASPSPETGFVVADAGSELLVAIEPELSAPFRLLEWLSDNGSGGFPQDFSDEHRRMEEWEADPR